MGGEIGGESPCATVDIYEHSAVHIFGGTQQNRQTQSIVCNENMLPSKQGMELLHHFVLMEGDYVTHMPKHRALTHMRAHQ